MPEDNLNAVFMSITFFDFFGAQRGNLGIENSISAAYDCHDPQSSQMVSAIPPGMVSRLEGLGTPFEPRTFIDPIDLTPQAA